MTQHPKYSILHTSARPDAWRKVYDAWLANADRPEDVEYVLVVDERWGFKIDPTYNAAAQLEMPRWVGTPDTEPLDKAFNLGWDHWKQPRNYVAGVNFAAKHATGKILIAVADDQFPCEHWDNELNKFNLQGECVTWVPTGTPQEFERGIIVMPIMTRSLYQSWGYVMYPSYESMFSDNDLHDHAEAQGVLFQPGNVPVFPHKHPLYDEKGEWRKTQDEVDKAGWDEAYKAQNRSEAYAVGQQILNARRANGFRDVKANVPTLINSKKKPTFVLCLPGETFSMAHEVALVNMLAFLSQHFDWMPRWGFSSSPDHTRGQMRLAALENGVPDFVLWIDDDQILSVDGLKLLIQDLIEHPEISLAAGWTWEEYDSNKPPMISAGVFVDHPGFESKACARFEHEYLMSQPHELQRVQWTGFPAVLMRGSLLVEAGDKAFVMIENDLAPFYRYGEDISFCMRVPNNLLVIDRRVYVPHFKTREQAPDARDLKRKKDVFQQAGAPA